MKYPYQHASCSFNGEQEARGGAGTGISFDGTEEYSFDALIRVSAHDADQKIITREGAFRFGLKWGTPYFELNGITALAGINRVHVNEWIHMCVVFDNTNYKLYVNGALCVERAVGLTGRDPRRQFVFGKDFQGHIRQVRFFNRALTDSQIVSYMMETNLELSEFRDTLAAYFDFSRVPAVEHIRHLSVSVEDDSMPVLHANGAIFNGSGFLDIANPPNVNPAGYHNDAYTVQCWVNFSESPEGTKQTIFCNGDISDTAGMSLYIERVGSQYKVKSLRGATVDKDEILCSNASLQPGEWVNIATTYSIDTLSIYINGELDSSISGLLPIARELTVPNLRMGAEVSIIDPKGQDWLRGMISRLDIWNLSLEESDLRMYAYHCPTLDTEGLGASYKFHIDGSYDTFGGTTISRYTDVILGEVTRNIPITQGYDGDLEEQIGQPSLSGGLGVDGPVLPGCLSDFVTDEPLSDEVLMAFREEALSNRRSALGQSVLRAYANANGITLDDERFFTVSSHKIDANTYFVAHNHNSSYTLCFADSNSLISEEAAWWIELLLIIVCGVAVLFCGYKIRGNKVLTSVLKKASTTPAVRTILGKPVTTKTLLVYLGKLITCGLIKEIFSCVLAGFSWIKTVLCVAQFALLVATSVSGGTVAYVVATLASVVVEVIIHIGKKPESVAPVEVTAISFAHSTANACINLKLDKSTPLSLPEWRSSNKTESHAAYALDRLNSSVSILASFTCVDKGFTPYRIRCRSHSDDRILGNSNEAAVSFSSGASVPPYKEFHFGNHKLRDNGVNHITTKLLWQYFDSEKNQWKDITTTTHNLYVVLQQPTPPWSNYQQPWVDVLAYSCKWAKGATTKEAVAKSITEKVNGSLSLKYDTVRGSPSYINQGNNKFMLTDFLKHLRDNRYKSVVNCYDCAVITSTFANALGCSLSQKIMTQNFACNEILAIGTKSWKKPFNGWFSYHAVCMMEPLQNSPCPCASPLENNHYVYDACLKFNGSATPAVAAGRQALLPTGIHFSEFPDSFGSVSPILAGKSYREHLTTNNSNGRGRCRYDFIRNNPAISNIYMDVE